MSKHLPFAKIPKAIRDAAIQMVRDEVGDDAGLSSVYITHNGVKVRLLYDQATGSITYLQT